MEFLIICGCMWIIYRQFYPSFGAYQRELKRQNDEANSLCSEANRALIGRQNKAKCVK